MYAVSVACLILQGVQLPNIDLLLTKMFGKKHAGGFDCSDRKLFLFIVQNVVTPVPPSCHRLNLATGRDKTFV